MSLLVNLVSYYKLDGNSNDAHGGRNGTDTSMTYGAVKINNGGAFNGTSSSISMTAPPGLSGDFSLSVWASRSTNSAFRILYESGNNLNYWRVGIDNLNQIIFTEDNIADYTFSGATMTNTNQLYHLVFVKSGTGSNNITLYVDGTSVGTASAGSVATASGTARVGSLGGVSNYWNNQIDELGIWSKALTGAEVTSLYNGGAGLSYDLFTSGSATPSRLMLMGVGS